MSEPHTVNTQYAKWKTTIPFLYDWFLNQNLTWPSLSCRWGAVLEDTPFKRKQLLYTSERTDGSDANKLMLLPVEICKPRVAAADSIAGFHESSKSPFVKASVKTIFHLGEVNKIREVPGHPNIVATHSDAKEIYVWHFDRQPHRGEKADDWKNASQPDLTLTGHEDNAEFALSISSASAVVASAGRDTNVLLWNLSDYDGGSLLNSEHGGGLAKTPILAASTKLQGHESTVEDVVFQPGSAAELASVGDDYALLLWDTRAGPGPSTQIPEAHKQQDVQCVDWSAQDTNMIATGGADGTLKIWDRRKTGGAQHTFELHTRPLMRVEWANYRPGILASGGEDGIVCVWDLNRKAPAGASSSDPPPESARARSTPPPELLFQHAGHRAGIADFQWHQEDPFTMVSVSDDLEGGTLQMWRINDLIYRPEAEVIAELEQFRDEILPKEKQTTANKAAAPNGEAKQAVAKAVAEPPKPVGGTAPAVTPAEAFVGVPDGVPPEGVPVTDQERLMDIDSAEL